MINYIILVSAILAVIAVGVPMTYLVHLVLADETINLDADKMEIHPDLGHIVTLTNANGNNEDETSVTINTP